MFSIVFPMDTARLPQFHKTKLVYDDMPQEKEFVIPTRSEAEVKKYLKKHNLMKDVRLIPYEWTEGFNPSMGLNLGIKNAKSEYVVITSPEVIPTTPVLEQLSELFGHNVICQTFDEREDGSTYSLVNRAYRNDSVKAHFLALFNKKDLLSINGFDEDFMYGYAYEDDDLGARWNRAGLPFEIREDINGLHQYHDRLETIPSGSQLNFDKFNDNTIKGIVFCKNGIVKQ